MKKRRMTSPRPWTRNPSLHAHTNINHQSANHEQTSPQETLETHVNRKQLSGTKNMRTAHKGMKEQLYFACFSHPIIQAGITQSQEGTWQLEKIPPEPLHFQPSRDQQSWTWGSARSEGEEQGLPGSAKQQKLHIPRGLLCR